MSGLLYKEFYQLRRDMALVFGLQVVGSIICIIYTFLFKQESDPEFRCRILLSLSYILFLALGSLMSSGFFSNDEKRPWNNFAISLPQTGKGLVAAEYYSVLIVHLMILFICFVTDTIVVALYGSPAVSGMMTAVLFFVIRILVNAIAIPFMLRFGAALGLNVEVACLGIILMLLGVYALFGDISIFLSGNILDALTMFLTSQNVIWFLALLPFVAALAYYISYRVSLKVYRKGAENYGQ